ncbi:MAG: PolC-type DNA polymerase III [Solirubrobacterales bacterium]
MAAVDSPAGRAYRDAALPEPRTPWREVPFVVVDLETTGLDPSRHEIISFATVRVAGGRVRLGDVRYELVRPGRMPDEDTIRIHGLREADLSEAPPLSELLGGLLEDLSGAAIVAHVAAVERGFLGAALETHGLALRNPIVDTAALDRELRRLRRKPYASREPIGLSEMARRLGLPVHRPHHADGDALTTAQAFIALAAHLEAIEPQTLGSLERASAGPVQPPLRSRLRRQWPF